jgi:hypothetical protein
VGYYKIPNLYKDPTILNTFKQVYVLEKVHGTSAHLVWKPEERSTLEHPVGEIRLFSGGAKHEEFEKACPPLLYVEKFVQHFPTTPVIVYGEAYGGKMQAMSHTYGKQLRFIAFEVKIGSHWLSVPDAFDVATKLGFEFVPFKLVSNDLATLNAERDAPSEVAKRLGIESPGPREGIVIRPPFEVTLNNGARIHAKHVAESFRETKTPREVNPDKAVKFADAKRVADEYVTDMRLTHVLGSLQPQAVDYKDIPRLIKAVVEDLRAECEDEIEWSREVSQAIGTATAKLYKDRLSRQNAARLLTEEAQSRGEY